MDTKKYFEKISEETEKTYEIARQARKQSKDPERRVDVPVATDLASKASSLVIAAKFPELEDSGVAERIRELEEEFGKNDERVAFSIAREMAEGKFYEFEEKERACDAGIRVGVSYMTGGITTAPLEGIGDIKIRTNDDGSNYLAVYYSGPIRSAGGTASAMSVLLADYVRIGVGLDEFKPSNTVIERYATEVEDYYNRVTAKQYNPTREETKMIADNVPVEVTGSPTENLDVSNYKDLDRVETNKIRGGMCLVYLDGLPLKAPKIKKRIEKWGSDFGLKHWEWVKEYLDLQKEIHSSDDSGAEEKETKYTPSDKYLGSLTAGRPIFAHPGRKGGFRPRYGHSRTNGLAAVSFHPATMEITQRFVAVGTQLKVEYPGKATVGTPCNTIEPPTVRLKNGNVVKVETREQAKEIENKIEEILFLGDILITYGEFLENGKKLLPSPYVEEWWEKEMDKALKEKDMELGRDFSERAPTPEEAQKISEALDIRYHPKWTPVLNDTNAEDFKQLYKMLRGMDYDKTKAKKCLEDLLIPHTEKLEIENKWKKTLKILLDLENDYLETVEELQSTEDVIEFVHEASGIETGRQSTHYLGARMGRPEKAAKRTLTGKPQLLFPCGKKEGGRMRNLSASYEQETVTEQVIHNRCTECGEITHYAYCRECDAPADPIWFCTDCGKDHDKDKPSECEKCGNERFNRYKRAEIDVKTMMDEAMENLGMKQRPELLKSFRGMTSKHKHVEPIEKGLLRQKYGLYVNKDATVRYDALDLPMTHFKPREIGAPVEKLRELGYKEDVNGEPLEREDQVLALKPQDIIIPRSEKSTPASEYFANVAQFIDELLEKFYGLEPFYQLESPEDLIGQLVIGLAPHTSGGTVGRIIGFTDAKGIYAHPYWHAAKRRNCLPGDTEVKLADGTASTLYELFEEARGAKEADTTGTVEKTLNKEVLTIENERVSASNASKVIRAPAQQFKIEFETKSGRKIEVFPDHRVKTTEGVKKARAVEEGDNLIVPAIMDPESESMDEIELADYLECNNLMVRNASEAVNQAIKELGGLKHAAQELGIPKKSLGNYKSRKSIPVELYEQLVDKTGVHAKNFTLSAKRDAVEIPSKLKVDSALMKLLGYYLAEGYYRKSEKKGAEFYQISFSFGEEESKEKMKEVIEQVFGITPSVADHELIISSRVVYEFFESIDIGKSAHEKRVPSFIQKMPKEDIKPFLSAYFAGDGSIEKDRLHVSACSASRKLIQDIDTLLKKFGIFARYSQQEKSAGGILIDKYGEEHYEGRKFVSHKIHVRSSHAVKFGKEIGFNLERKQSELESSYSLERKPREKRNNLIVEDEIVSKTILKSEERFMYDLEVDQTHNFITSENICTMNCDGDEDAILLLMDGLLNFSRDFLPDMTGARTMDAPLILSTVLNPDEVDDEAWAIETVSEYPLQFYYETQEYKQPWEIDCDIEVGEDVVHSDEAFKHGYTHETTDIDDGPQQSEYVTLDEMSEKTKAQLGISEKIRAADENAAAELLLQKHFLPDIRGNLRSFSKQQMRCVKCNEKFRRVPMTNQTIAPTGKTTSKCPDPDCEGKVLLTISEGTIKKYMQPSKDIVEHYEISPYMRQQVHIINRSLQGLFGKDQRQSGLKQFT